MLTFCVPSREKLAYQGWCSIYKKAIKNFPNLVFFLLNSSPWDETKEQKQTGFLCTCLIFVRKYDDTFNHLRIPNTCWAFYLQCPSYESHSNAARSQVMANLQVAQWSLDIKTEEERWMWARRNQGELEVKLHCIWFGQTSACSAAPIVGFLEKMKESFLGVLKSVFSFSLF